MAKQEVGQARPAPRLEGHEGRRRLGADLSLLLATAIWGTTFVLVKEAVVAVPPFTFLAFRFSIATAALLLLYGPRLRKLRRQEVGAGIVVGVFLCAGFALQTIGLQFTLASTAGFITGLCVVLVPVIAFWWLHQRPSWGVAAGVGSATVGLALLSLRADLTFSAGDLLMLLCAVAFALQIVAVGKYALQSDPLGLAVVQVGFVALASWIAALVTEGPLQPPPAGVLPALLFLGIAATALVFGIQNVAQRFTTATHAALIFTLEPVFAAFFAYLWLAEELTVRSAIGAALILAGMLAAELWQRNGRRAPSGDDAKEYFLQGAEAGAYSLVGSDRRPRGT